MVKLQGPIVKFTQYKITSNGTKRVAREMQSIESCHTEREREHSETVNFDTDGSRERNLGEMDWIINGKKSNAPINFSACELHVQIILNYLLRRS